VDCKLISEYSHSILAKTLRKQWPTRRGVTVMHTRSITGQQVGTWGAHGVRAFAWECTASNRLLGSRPLVSPPPRHLVHLTSTFGARHKSTILSCLAAFSVSWQAVTIIQTASSTPPNAIGPVPLRQAGEQGCMRPHKLFEFPGPWTWYLALLDCHSWNREQGLLRWGSTSRRGKELILSAAIVATASVLVKGVTRRQ